MTLAGQIVGLQQVAKPPALAIRLMANSILSPTMARCAAAQTIAALDFNIYMWVKPGKPGQSEPAYPTIASATSMKETQDGKFRSKRAAAQ